MSKENRKTINSKTIYSWNNLSLIVDKISLPNEKEADYTFVKHPGSVVIIPFLSDTQVLVVEQYRYPIKALSIEFPAGGVGKNEDNLRAAHRELTEETGYRAEKLTFLGSFFASNSMSNEQIFVFKATGLKKADRSITSSVDEAEFIKYIPMDFQEVINSIMGGQITDGPTIAAAFLAQRFLRQHE